MRINTVKVVRTELWYGIFPGFKLTFGKHTSEAGQICIAITLKTKLTFKLQLIKIGQDIYSEPRKEDLNRKYILKHNT